MDKNKLAAIEILSKVKDNLNNIVASGEYTNDDKRNLVKTKAALKWLREGKQPINDTPAGGLNKHDVSQQRELFVSFARFAHNYGKGSYATSYEEMFSEWLKKRNK